MELENNYPFPCIMEVADHRFSPKYRTFICITRDLPSELKNLKMLFLTLN